MPLILAPLPYIAMHFLQTPAIWGKLFYRGGLTPIFPVGGPSVCVVRIEIRQHTKQGGAVMERRCGARAAGVFPLSLSRKTVEAACTYS